MAGVLALVVAGDGAVGSGSLVDSPLTLLGCAASGYLLGAWTRPIVAVAGALAAGAALTFANQRHFPGHYPLVDDLVFFLLVVGAPALAGASLVARAAQVRELSELSQRLAAQRRDELAAARLEEQHRIQLEVHHRLVEQMGAIALRAEGARHEADGRSREQALADVETTARAGLDDLRRALGLLREEEGPDQPAARAPRGTVTEPPPGWSDLLLAAGLGAAMAVESVVSDAARGPAVANILAAFAVAAPLVVRRRHPVAATGLVLAAAAPVSSVLTPIPVMVTALALLLVASYAVGCHARGWWRAAGTAVAWLGCLAVGLASPPGARDPEGLLPTMIWVALAVVAGTIAAGWSQRAAQVQEIVEDLDRGRDADIRVAVARQRQEMARDLHDSVAHTMTVVCLNAGAARRVAGTDPDTRGEALATIVQASRAGMGELRRGLDVLEPADALRAPSLRGMAEALGVDLHVSLHAGLEPAASDAALLHRVLREAVVNAARHAPGARVEARLEVRDGLVRLEVTDDGPGTPSSAGRALGSGSGLAGLAALLRERGGELDYGPAPTGGFLVAATLPLRAEVPA